GGSTCAGALGGVDGLARAARAVARDVGVGSGTRPSIRLGAGLPSGGGVGRGGTGDDGGGGAFRGVGARRGGRASRGARRSIGAHGIDAPRAVRGVLLGRVVVATCQRHEERGGETGG